MDDPTRELAEPLSALVVEHVPGASGIRGLARLSGGASKEAWSFDAVTAEGDVPLLLRRATGGVEADGELALAMPLADEAALIEAVFEAGVPVPRVHFRSARGSPLGSGFVMDRLSGTGDPLRVIHDPALAPARERLAFELGALCGKLQGIELSRLPALSPPATLEDLARNRHEMGVRSPVVELALRWLDDNRAEPAAEVLVHGDFRNSNLIVSPEGLRGLIDWELARRGDPMHDLSFCCVPSWRFGARDKPVGGFGELEDLFAGYAATRGREVDRARFHYFLVWNTLWWAVGTAVQLHGYRSGFDRSPERGAIGRRLSETELDLLDLLEER